MNHLENSHPYASALNNMALVYQALKEYEKAIHFTRNALAIMEGDKKYTQKTATTYSNLAVLYGLVGDDNAFWESLDKALKLFEATDNASDPHYAAALNNLAAFSYNRKKYQKAIELYQKILSLTEHYFGQNVEYAITCQSLGYASCISQIKISKL